MKKIGILILLTIVSNVALANNEDFQTELQLPKAHYSQAQKKVIVQVVADEKNYDNLQQQQIIIDNIKNQVSNDVEVQELIVNESEN